MASGQFLSLQGSAIYGLMEYILLLTIWELSFIDKYIRQSSCDTYQFENEPEDLNSKFYSIY